MSYETWPEMSKAEKALGMLFQGLSVGVVQVRLELSHSKFLRLMQSPAMRKHVRVYVETQRLAVAIGYANEAWQIIHVLRTAAMSDKGMESIRAAEILSKEARHWISKRSLDDIWKQAEDQVEQDETWSLPADKDGAQVECGGGLPGVAEAKPGDTALAELAGTGGAAEAQRAASPVENPASPAGGRSQSGVTAAALHIEAGQNLAELGSSGQGLAGQNLAELGSFGQDLAGQSLAELGSSGQELADQNAAELARIRQNWAEYSKFRGRPQNEEL